MEAFTIIDEMNARDVQAQVTGGRVLLAPDELQRTLGWTLSPEGLCRGERCIPLPDRRIAHSEDGIDLSAFASLTLRPLALDVEARVAALGTSAGERADRLNSGAAPDFQLPDLAGRRHRLTDSRGKKVLLVAYASW